MNTKIRPIMAIVFVAILILPGCSLDRRYWLDAQQDQPWVAHNLHGIAYISSFSTIEQAWSWLEWVDSYGRVVVGDSRKVTKKCELYLRRKGAWDESEHTMISDQRDIPLHFRSQFKFPAVKRVRKIVCLTPIVVVEGPGLTYYSALTLVDNFNVRRHPGKMIEVEVMLDRGFTYGTRVPYEPEPRWFSPDLKLGPITTERISENKRRIAVPWGSLILTHEGDEWVVTTQSDIE